MDFQKAEEDLGAALADIYGRCEGPKDRARITWNVLVWLARTLRSEGIPLDAVIRKFKEFWEEERTH